MSKTIENLKNGNYAVVDNQGVSVTRHFIECLEKEFADLEAKLEEMTGKYNACQEARKLEIEFNKQDKAKLKQQLFDSGLKTLEEIKLSEQRKKMLEDLSTKNWELEHQLAEKQKENNELHIAINKMSIDLTNLLKGNQDKISFAVEQLEKVKEFNVQQVFSSKPLDNFIDNQIKQLKEGK